MIIQEIDKKIINYSKTTKNKKILDIGCGENKYKQYFCKYNNFIGIDVEKSGRIIKDKNPDIFYDGNNIPFEDASIDIILCTEVLEHVEDFNLLKYEIFRVLKIKGTAIITMPFITAEHEIPYDFRRLTSYGIKNEFEKVGFKIHKFEKILHGHAAIRQLLYGEMKRFENSKKINLLIRFFVKSLFRVSFRILGLFYNLDRVYFDNYIEIIKDK
tara:strand:+ start:204 stop:845 length:642 start_codon:yes stop_codon:yes gene_type:complete